MKAHCKSRTLLDAQIRHRLFSILRHRMLRLMTTMLLALLSGEVSAQQGCQKRQMVTFNTGLTPSVDNYATRKTLVPRALASVPADVMCLQEVWFASDVRNIVENLKDKFPYTWSSIHSSVHGFERPQTSVWQTLTDFSSFPCSDVNYISFLGCVVYRCSSSAANRLQCLQSNCFNRFTQLSESCRACIVMGSERSIGSIRSYCQTPRTESRMNADGLMILSKYSISSAGSSRFFPAVPKMVPRGYLQVEIQNVGTVLCTHLSASLPSDVLDKYPETALQTETGIASYRQQQRAEINILVHHLSSPHILLGDMNTGPAIPSKQLDGEFPENYEVFVTNGYENIYLAKEDSQCTWCADNTLVTQNRSLGIDHVLVRGMTAVSGQRVLMNKLDDEFISDHYGVQVSVCAAE